MSLPKTRKSSEFLQWTRLEPRSRTEESLARGMRAEVRDALWLLARQQQFGELRATDGGSPVSASLTTESYRMRAPTRGAGAADASVAIEACREAVGLRAQLDCAAAALLALEEAGVSADLRAALRAQFPLAGDDSVAALGFAGVDLLRALAAGVGVDAVAAAPAAQRPLAEAALAHFHAAYASLLQRLSETGSLSPPTAWSPERLEHAGAVPCSADSGGTAALAFDELVDGHIDHARFDLQASSPGDLATREVLLAPATAPWLPRPRMFEIEGHPLDLARLDLTSADPGRVLFTEFVLQFDGEWALLPVTAEAGTVVGVSHLTVHTSFGRHVEVSSASSVSTSSPTRLFEAGRRAGVSFLVVGASLPFVLDGPPSEEVFIARDEWSNLVWAVEGVTPGFSHAGDRRAGSPPPVEPEVSVATLRIRRDPPPGWFAYEPVTDVAGIMRFSRVAGSGFASALLAQLPSLREEEVPREGLVVRTAFHRARDARGDVVTWLARRVTPGGGETSSGMAFDRLTEPTAAPADLGGGED